MNVARVAVAFALATTVVGGCAASHDAVAPRASLAPPTIAPVDADVWAWSVDVGGDAPPPLVSCRVGSASARVAERRWSARIALHPGTNRVRATCSDAEGRTSESAVAELRAMLRDAPKARITKRDGRLDASTSTPSEGSHAPIVDVSWSREDDGTVARLDVRDARGATDVARLRIAPRTSERDDVIYGVVPPLFGAPPLRAVTSALADLAELGVSVLWLSPVFETPPKDYGYAVTDYLRVRADYGTEADLAALVDAAHRRGLRVVLDLVPNHTSAEHRYFRQASALGPASHYFLFYERDAEGRPQHYFDWSHLPNLRYANDEVSTFMLEVATHWMRALRVDGYRIDAAWGIEQRAPAFWKTFVDETRRIDPDAVLVAEASARDPFWREHGFDAGYDWTDEPGHWAWEHAFDDPASIADRIHEAVVASPTHVVRFLENNDTGKRFVTRHGEGLTRVAAAALATLPGTPALFTGQERGAEYEPYATTGPLANDDPRALRSWYRTVLRWRRQHPALRGDGYARVPVSSRYVLAYERWNDRGSRALVILHFGSERTRVRVEGADHDLPPWSARVLPASQRP